MARPALAQTDLELVELMVCPSQLKIKEGPGGHAVLTRLSVRQAGHQRQCRAMPCSVTWRMVQQYVLERQREGERERVCVCVHVCVCVCVCVCM